MRCSMVPSRTALAFSSIAVFVAISANIAAQAPPNLPGGNPALAPDGNPAAEPTQVNPDVEALRELNADYESHLAQYEVLLKASQEIVQALKNSERDLASIRSAAIQRQMASAQLSMMRILSSVDANNLVNAVPPIFGGNIVNTGGNNFVVGNQIAYFPAALAAQQQNAINMLAQLRISDELRELDASARQKFDQYVGLLQKLSDANQTIQKWWEEEASYMEQFIKYSDVTGRRTSQERAELIEVLRLLDNKNMPGTITRGMLERRQLNLAEANQDFTKVIDFKGSLTAIALAARGEAHSVAGESSKAKADITAASRMAEADPQVWWLRGQAAAGEKNWNAAISDFQRIVKVGSFEGPARRNLALIQGIQGQRRKTDAIRALENARIATSLTNDAEWSSMLALALALQVTGNQGGALEAADKALKLAKDEQIAVCEEVRTHISNGTPYVWDFKKF